MARDTTAAVEPSLSHSLIHNLWKCGHFLHNYVGGRGGRSRILGYIHKNGGEVSQFQILEEFQLKSGTLSEVLTKLESDGMIERFRDDADKRKQVVRITELGEGCVGETVSRLDHFENHAFDGLSEEERTQLLGLLERVIGHWEEMI